MDEVSDKLLLKFKRAAIWNKNQQLPENKDNPDADKKCDAGDVATQRESAPATPAGTQCGNVELEDGEVSGLMENRFQARTSAERDENDGEQAKNRKTKEKLISQRNHGYHGHVKL